jgi:hypothetical protein
MSTTKQIKYALNELKSSVSHQVRCIKNDISSLDVYKSNYDALFEIPLVKKLLKDNEILRNENDKLEKQLLSILLEKHNKKNKKQQKSLYKDVVDVDVESDAVKILDICDIPIKKEKPTKEKKPTKKENIVYELIEEKCDIVLDSNIKQNINVEKKEYIEFVVVEEEEEEVVVEEEEEEVVVEEEEEEVVVEEEEVEVVVEEEDEEEEVVVEEEDEEVEVVVEEEDEEVKYNVVKEVVEEEVVEEEVVEEEVVEEEVVEEEVVEEEEEEEEEEEVYEVTIKGKTYYVMNEKNSIIYDIDENGDISIEVGAYKNGKPVFTKVNK